ncbi:isochorismate synthase MenF [Kineococcus sp. TBRC 1896]|uniref:isochorismate synthase n=1 Tax=Kineococcus mangrovi TaxID=1660183 RepID=A0ABV4I224_9ACTN
MREPRTPPPRTVTFAGPRARWSVTATPVDPGAPARVQAGAARNALRDGDRTVLAGLLPFDVDVAGTFLTGHRERVPEPRADLPAGRLVEDPGARDRYTSAVADVLRRIDSGEVDKVVLSRSVRFETTTPVDPQALLDRLAAVNPAAQGFCADLPVGTLVGASPELLCRRSGREVLSHPLAGSVPRQADPVLDEEAGARLAVSAKDLREHAVVVADIVERLGPLAVVAPVGPPRLVRTPAMWHLGTEVRAHLRDEATDSLDLALALHPTPAVCGTPRRAAAEVIRRLEEGERGGYAGAVGFQDRAGDGAWWVAIRCALVDGRTVRAHAGGGIVAGSDPAAEHAETTAKLRTVLAALARERTTEVLA